MLPHVSFVVDPVIPPIITLKTEKDCVKHLGSYVKFVKKKKHHFAAVCQSGRTAQAAAIDEPENSIIRSITSESLYKQDTYTYPDHCLYPTRAADLVPVVGQLRGEGPVTSVPLSPPHSR